MSEHQNTQKKIVTFGGGTGQPQLLRALRAMNAYDLTAVVTVMDTGGSSGCLREQLHILPPGDIRRCITALSAEPDLDREWEYRYTEGEHAGHTVGNLILSDLFQQYDIHTALQNVEKRYSVEGHVLPVTTEFVDLVAILSNGTRIIGETHIDHAQYNDSLFIEQLELSTTVETTLQVKAAIHQADYIILSYGDLFTSLIPNLLVSGVTQAIAESNAHVVYVCNRTTKKGETHNFTTADFYATVSRYLAPARIDTVIIDTQETPVPYGSQAVLVEKISSVKIAAADLANEKNSAHLSGEKVACMIHSICTSS